MIEDDNIESIGAPAYEPPAVEDLDTSQGPVATPAGGGSVISPGLPLPEAAPRELS